MNLTRTTKPQTGFTLTELTIVLVIVALLIGGMLVPLSAQRDLQSASETRKQLSDINDALLGFASANGRLPCPATINSNGQESFCTEGDPSKDCGDELISAVTPTHGRCFNFFSGFVPAATLGLSPTDSQGFAIDAWGNQLRYGISNKGAGLVDFPFTKLGGIKAVWAVDPSPLQTGLLRICAHITGSDCPTAADRITDNAVVVLFSTGKNGGTAPVSADELANWTNSSDRVFVSATPSAAFDDLVTWNSPNIIFNRMISAGRLP